MIVITKDSLKTSLDLLKTVDFNSTVIFFNDGVYSYQIVSLSIQYDDFEANGMFQRLESRFTLHLSGSEDVVFYFDDVGVKFAPHKSKLPTQNVGVPTEVAQYNI